MNGTSPKRLIENDIELNESSVWILKDKKPFDYSDGRVSEHYLEKVFSEVEDLSSDSYDLQKYIRDWTSEYYLSRKRSQLLRGFNFDQSKKVLEVGCGCGSITRFLGERFDEVLSIEGSLARAKLARMRTKDLDNVSILAAPFQEVRFREKFDIIFCIGVFEYSEMFVDSAEPFDFILRYFYDLLTPAGELVIAIENQFGLKYFSWGKEDHNGIMFDGIEGYPRHPKKEKTFGYDELKAMAEKHFSKTEFYFPYPDYKVPSCVLSEDFLSKVKAGEMIGSFQPSNYIIKRKGLFDERLALLELDKNNKLPFFANSFLLVAGKQNVLSTKLEALGVSYSSDRIRELQTVSRFVEHEDGSIWTEKKLLNGCDKIDVGKLTLHSCSDKWVGNLSIHMRIMRRAKEKGISVGELFHPCKIWLKTLRALSSKQGAAFLLDGKYIDCIWSNSFIDGEKCVFIDKEWEWNEKINLNVLFVRSVFMFVTDVSSLGDIVPLLKMNSMKRLIVKIANSLDVTLTDADFAEFCEIESQIMHEAYGLTHFQARAYIKLAFKNRLALSFVRFNKSIFERIGRKLWRCFIKAKLAVKT